MKRLADDLARELGRFDGGGAMLAIVTAWPRSVGPAVARNAWPARLARDGTLHVAASSSAWAFELAQLAPSLLERLREELAEAAPTGLRFVVGAVPEPPPAAPAPGAPTGVRPRPEDEELARSLAAAIEDEELRKLVVKAAAAALARPGSGGSVW